MKLGATAILTVWIFTCSAVFSIGADPSAPALPPGAAPLVAPLSESDKARIRAEEIYRAEAQKELSAADKSKDNGGTFWDALNSSFVIWLLSSVVVSGITAGYAAYQHRHANLKAKKDLIDKLDTEISNRIYEALSAIRSYEGSARNGAVSHPMGYYGLMTSYLNNRFLASANQVSPDFSIFPEFKDSGFRSLVTQLYDAVEHPANIEFKEVLATFESFNNLGSIAVANPDCSKENLLRVLAEIRGTINTRILKDRWRKDDLY